MLGLALGLQYRRGLIGGAISFVTQIINSLISRGTIVENITATTAYLEQLETDGLLDKASILVTATSVSTSVIHSAIPIDGGADLTFTRNDTATRVNESGTIEDVIVNMPRLDFSDGVGSILFEPLVTNLYINSETLVTQNISTTATIYTVSFYGTGTITFSGSYAGSLVGTGVNDRVSLTFTATAGTLISTVTGTVTQGQINNLPYLASYVPTLGVPVSKIADTSSTSGLSTYLNSENLVFYLDIKSLINESNSNQRTIQLSGTGGAGSNELLIQFLNTGVRILYYVNNTLLINSNQPLNLAIYNKIAVKLSPTNIGIFINGIKVLNSNGTFSQIIGLDILNFSRSGAAFFEGRIKGLQIENQIVTDADVITLTTP